MSSNTSAVKAPINWLLLIVLTLTPLAALILIPWYAWTHDFSMAAWISFCRHFGAQRSEHHRGLPSPVVASRL